MIRGDNRELFRLVVMVSIVAQLFIFAPHHHHDSSETPCYNVSHCLFDSEHQAEEQSDASHEHHHGGELVCGVVDVDVVAPQGKQKIVEIEYASLHFLLLPFDTRLLSVAEDYNVATHARAILDEDVGDGGYIKYIKAAIPPRAPDFIV